MRIALVGSSHSGKTTLAKALRDAGWYHANYTDMLKELAATALTAATKQRVTVEDILSDKKLYRPFLNELGTVLGFDRGYGIDAVLARWAAQGSPTPICFDCIRFEGQAAKLRELGFVMVGLQVSQYQLKQRALDNGVTREEFERQYEWDQHNLPESDIILDGLRPTQENVEILNRLSGVRSYAKVA